MKLTSFLLYPLSLLLSEGLELFYLYLINVVRQISVKIRHSIFFLQNYGSVSSLFCVIIINKNEWFSNLLLSLTLGTECINCFSGFVEYCNHTLTYGQFIPKISKTREKILKFQYGKFSRQICWILIGFSTVVFYREITIFQKCLDSKIKKFRYVLFNMH